VTRPRPKLGRFGGIDMTEPTKNEDVTVETLIEDVSIDGMCGVY
jgi:mycofactocin precursor